MSYTAIPPVGIACHLNLSFGGVVCKDEDKGYRARYYNQRFGNKQGALFGTVFLSFRDGSFDLTFTDISAFYGDENFDSSKSQSSLNLMREILPILRKY